MANLQASKKDIVKSIKNRQENLLILSRARTEVKKVRKMISESQSLEDISKQMSVINSVCSKATKKNIYHKNKTARIMSRLTHSVKKKVQLI